MRISAVRFSGFRGARGAVSLDLSSSFVVIVGRNGTGKSTICDAIEYALTGELRPDSSHKEKNESIMNYIWWRGGDEPPDRRFVEVDLTDDAGQVYQIRRTQTENILPPKLVDVLCANYQLLEKPLSELCRTTILRDEDITRLSVDLKETERFDAVRSALGTADFSSIQDRAEKVVELIESEKYRCSQRYNLANSRVTDITARLSQARTESANPEAVEAAQQLLKNHFPDESEDRAAMIDKAVKHLASVRGQVDALMRSYGRLQAYERRFSAFQNQERIAVVTATEAEVLRLREASQQAEREAAELNDALANLQAQSPRNASLALLREHGQRLSLLNGCCPLCGVEQSAEHYTKHLAKLEKEIAESSTALADLTRRSTESTTRVTSLKTELGRSSARLLVLQREESELSAESKALKDDARRYNFELSDSRTEPARLAQFIETLRIRASDFETAIHTIRASGIAEQSFKLETELRVAKEELSAAERRLAKATKAMHAGSEAVDTIKRTRGEFVNEQLAQLEPLLVELYQRLRPHVDWPTVHYRLRGDVRRMLRLEVGDGLNPSFVFSSGQRRTAGLAFLLALHLSRSWCKLRSLILDDPVQHIDDYRALHLTELLAALRSTERQIICAIEDEALGKLLARRLRVGRSQAGMIVQMAYSSRDGIHVADTKWIQPMPANILIPTPASA